MSLLNKQMHLLQSLKQKTKMDLLVKASAMRSKSCEKRKEIENEEKNIDRLQKKPQQM